MKKPLKTLLIAASVAGFASYAIAKDFTILEVGSEKISSADIQEVWKGLFPEGAAPDFATFDENIRQNVLRGVASERLIYAEAVKAGFDKSDEVKKRLAAAEKQIVMQAFMDNKAKSIVTDADLKAAYKEKTDAAKNELELKARHILVASEDEAKAVVAELKKNGDFDKIAKEKSTDKGSGARGGDLGWFTKDKMVPEFAKAAFALKDGELSAPVKSPFGWHVIKAEERRPVKVAAFEDMKEGLKDELTNKKVQAYVEELLAKADIKYYGEDGKPKELQRSFAKPEDKADAKPKQ